MTLGRIHVACSHVQDTEACIWHCILKANKWGRCYRVSKYGVSITIDPGDCYNDKVLEFWEKVRKKNSLDKRPTSS